MCFTTYKSEVKLWPGVCLLTPEGVKIKVRKRPGGAHRGTLGHVSGQSLDCQSEV